MTMPSVTRQGEGRPAIPVGLDAFTPIAEAWGLSTDDQIRLLGSPARSTFFKWKKEGGALPRDTADRISHLLAICKAYRKRFFSGKIFSVLFIFFFRLFFKKT